MLGKYITPRLSQKCQHLALPALAFAWLLIGIASYLGLVTSPPDYQQGDAVRIMYLHVPAAWLAMLCYGVMASSGVAWLVWKNPTADLLSTSIAPIGACFCLITLLTGSLWGAPIWGTWWVWDARLTSMLLLFLLYLGFLSIYNLQGEKPMRARAVLAVVGALNLPIIKFSVQWWNTLHQPASILRTSGLTIAEPMRLPLFLMFAGFLLLTCALTLLGVESRRFMKKQQRRACRTADFSLQREQQGSTL
jgi:heme exporter protein C